MKKIVVFVIICFILVLTACGRNRTDNNQPPDNGRTVYNGEGGTGHGGIAMPPPTDAVVLSVSAVPFVREQVVRAAFDSLQERMAQQGVTLYLDLSGIFGIGAAEINDYFTRLLSRYAAGEGPDIIFVHNHSSLIPFMDDGFLGDIYAHIDQSPTLSREDFFMNVLEPLEVDGRLYFMPLFFSYEFIGINATVPQPFIDRFAALDVAAMSDITDIYLDLINEHPEFADFALVRGMNRSRALQPEFCHLVDIANRSANFDDDSIVDLFDAVRRGFENYDWENRPVLYHFPSYEEMELVQNSYIFSSHVQAVGLNAVFDFEQEFFVHNIPRSDERGNLVIRPLSGIAVSSTANPIVLDFIKYYIQEIINTPLSLGYTLAMPILKEYVDEALDTGIRNDFHRIERATVSGVEQIDSVISRMRRYSEMEATISTLYSYLSWQQAIDVFNELMESDISAREAIERLEQHFNYWLNPQVAIQPLPDAEQPDMRAYLPVRTLTILAYDSGAGNPAGIIRQAAAALNASWAAQDRGYTFNVEIDSYSFENAHARQTRLQTELMAGGGPDMFILDFEHPIRAYASSGFLVDIYTLIDECPHTSRDDFFGQALAAYEMDGGLYMFPLSFGFQYISINATLPQSVIDRFAQFETISISQLLELYYDIIAEYGDDLGHLYFMPNLDILDMRFSLFNGFVDFDARTSNLMDEGFISLLEKWAPLCPWDGSGIGVIRGYFTSTFSINTLQYFTNYYMFRIDSTGLNPSYAFLTPAEAHFKHHIPLTDEAGRLIIDTDFIGHIFRSNWATVCITTAGDSALAWEFTRYLIAAFSQPTAAARGGHGVSLWGDGSLTTPIQRSLYDRHVRRAFERFALPAGHQARPSWLVAAQTLEDLQREIDSAVIRLAAYNEMPMVLRDPFIPGDLISEPLNHVSWGMITPREAAQRLHNAITLWLME